MPIYVFKCHKCKEIKEELFKNIYNNEIIICPVCQKYMDLHISFKGNFNLKGAGFYINDYRRKKK